MPCHEFTEQCFCGLDRAVVIAPEIGEIEQEIVAAIRVWKQPREQLFGLMDRARLISLHSVGILRVALCEEVRILQLERTSFCGPEARLTSMIDECLVGQRGAVAAAIRPHDEVVFLVVSSAVGLVEETELAKDGVFDEQAESHGGGCVVEVRQLG